MENMNFKPADPLQISLYFFSIDEERMAQGKWNTQSACMRFFSLKENEICPGLQVIS